MKRLLSVITVATALSVLGSTATNAEAQARFGGHGSYNSEFDLGLGARASFSIGSLFEDSDVDILKRMEVMAALDYFFPNCGSFGSVSIDCSWWEINGNLTVPFPGALGAEATAIPYVGLGLSRGSLSMDLTDGSDRVPLAEASGTAFNLLGGIRFGAGRFPIFAEARYRAAEEGQFILTAGVMFGR